MIEDTPVQASPQIINLAGTINTDTAREVCKALISRNPTLLLIDSGGGEVESGSILTGAILNNGKVVGVVTGKASSMAIPVFQACRTRIMVEDATMLFHSGTFNLNLPSLAVFDQDRIYNLVKDRREAEVAYEEMVLRGVRPDKKRAKEFNLTLDLLRKWRRSDTRLSARDALAYGLCDIVLPFSALFSDKILKEVSL